VVANIREYVPDDRFYVCNECMHVFKPYPDADVFKRQLFSETRLAQTQAVRDDPGKKGVSRLAPRLRRSIGRDIFGTQIIGMRQGESGSRERRANSLYFQSLGNRAAGPIREWSARDVWAVIVDRDVPYPTHYDKQAHTIGDGSPRDYEQVRMGGLFRWTGSDADGISHWRDLDIMAREWERPEHAERRDEWKDVH